MPAHPLEGVPLAVLGNPVAEILGLPAQLRFEGAVVEHRPEEGLLGQVLDVLPCQAPAAVGGEVVDVREDALEDLLVGDDGPVFSGE